MPDEVEKAEGESAPRSFWSGTISFGLVSIPVSLYPANRSSRVHARSLGPDGTPLGRRYYSSQTNQELPAEEMVRGYEIEKDRYVLVTDDELDRLAPKKSRDIDLREFVDVNQIPPLYFERGYFLMPAGDSTKAYLLLAAILEKTHRAGIATFVMRGKEYLTAITAENGILLAEALRFTDELRSPADIGLPERTTAPAERTRRFVQIIQKHTSPQLSPDELRDETSAELLKTVQEKLGKKQGVVMTGEQEGSSEATPDLVAVLKKSLAAHQGQRPKHFHGGSGHGTRRAHGSPTRVAKHPGR